MTEVAVLAPAVMPALIEAAGERASVRFLEFFAAAIRSPHTRRAYGRAVADFLAWCEDRGVRSLIAVQPLDVAAWVEQQAHTKAAPTAKLRLAALRHLFDWLVVSHVLPTNPALLDTAGPNSMDGLSQRLPDLRRFATLLTGISASGTWDGAEAMPAGGAPQPDTGQHVPAVTPARR